MMNRRDNVAVARLMAERRRREDDAPRLLVEVPRLSSLRLDIYEGNPGDARAVTAHIRRIVVERAPALFVARCCSETSSRQGGVHDFTRDVMTALQQGRAHFEGDVACNRCTCVLRYFASAFYSQTTVHVESSLIHDEARRRCASNELHY